MYFLALGYDSREVTRTALSLCGQYSKTSFHVARSFETYRDGIRILQKGREEASLMTAWSSTKVRLCRDASFVEDSTSPYGLEDHAIASVKTTVIICR